jgi:hypothetical protein
MSGWRRNAERGAGPSGPHRFVEPEDNRLGLALGMTQPTLQMGPALAVSDASLRAARCARKGCGRARQHAIHDVQE